MVQKNKKKTISAALKKQLKPAGPAVDASVCEDKKLSQNWARN